MESRIFHTRSEEETIALGRQLGTEFTHGVVLLIGNLGAGKTTLAKGIVEGRNGTPANEVSSPTFTLIHQYGHDAPVYHIDLYRLDEARAMAAQSRLMGSTRPTPDPLRVALGLALIRLGRALAGQAVKNATGPRRATA